MLKILLLLAFTPQLSETLTLRLSAEVSTFTGWTLVLEDGSKPDFDAAGVVTTQRIGDGFEIVDDQQRSRFFGMFANYPHAETVIRIGPPVLSVHQVVSASRIQQQTFDVAGDIEVIRPDETVGRAPAQTSDWLKQRAAVLIQKTNLGGGSPIIRGMSGNRILLMVDGFRLNNSTFRLGLNQYLNTIPSTMVEQIEVFKGPTGVMYGSDGLGGVIHLRSRDPASFAGTGGRWSGRLQSGDDTWSQNLIAHHNFGNTHVSGHFGYHQYDHSRAGGDVGSQIPTGFLSRDGSLNLTHVLDKNRRIRIINSHSRANHVPRTDRIQSGRDLLWEYHPQRQSLHGLRYESSVKRAWTDHMDLGIGFLKQEEGNVRISAGDPQTRTNTFLVDDTYQLNAAFTKVTPGVQWVYGFDGQWDGVDAHGSSLDLPSGRLTSVPGKFPNDSTYRLLGAFVTSEWRLTARQGLKLGLRQTRADLEGTLEAPIGGVRERYQQLTPSASWFIKKGGLFASLSVGQGFRAPNLEDALSLGPSNQGFDAPNPGLDPESMWNYELNLRRRTSRDHLELALYHGRYQDLIERTLGTWRGAATLENEPVFILDNVGKAEINGISLAYRRQLGQAQSLMAEGSWTHGTQTQTNVPMTRIPPLRGNLTWRHSGAAWQSSAVFDWAARQDRLSPGDLEDSRIPITGTPGYGVLHLRTQYQWGERITLKSALENVGDKLYKQHGSGIYDSGRRLVLELQARFQ